MRYIIDGVFVEYVEGGVGGNFLRGRVGSRGRVIGRGVSAAGLGGRGVRLVCTEQVIHTYWKCGLLQASVDYFK